MLTSIHANLCSSLQLVFVFLTDNCGALLATTRDLNLGQFIGSLAMYPFDKLHISSLYSTKANTLGMRRKNAGVLIPRSRAN